MANLSSAIDSVFWDNNISTPQTLESTARSVPGEPFPVDGSRASRSHRIQQLTLLREGFPLGIIPSFAPSSDKRLGSFSLNSLLLSPSSDNWWLGLVGQFKPKKLFADIKADIKKSEKWDLKLVKETTKHFVDKSLYSVGLWTQIALGEASSLLLSAERLGDKDGVRKKLMFVHPLEEHDLTVEAAWPDLFLDRKGRFWDVPESLSFDVSSLEPESGLKYRFGVHNSRGDPQPVNAGIESGGDVPTFLLPGLCAKGAVSYKANRTLWRPPYEKKDNTEGEDKKPASMPYDIRLKEPRAAVSGIVGSSLAAWITGRGMLVNGKKRSPINADAFGSACFTFQKGRFTKNYNDLTRVDARVDISSASALAKRIFQAIRRSSDSNISDDTLWSPRLNLIFQQQVAGPIVMKVDSQFQVGAGKYGVQMEDVIYSLNYSLRLLDSGKVVAWYSPKRKEGMVEVRVFEF